METHAVIDPFDVLLNMAEHTCKVARPLPVLEKEIIWTGIGIQLGVERFVLPINEVVEILRYPEISAVPGMQSWLLGLTNLRGVLLTVTDIYDFLKDRTTPLAGEGRVVVVRHQEHIYGLMVDKIFGLQHFPKGDKSDDVPAVDEAYRLLLRGHFKEESGVIWPILDLGSLVGMPKFKQVGINDAESQITE